MPPQYPITKSTSILHHLTSLLSTFYPLQVSSQLCSMRYDMPVPFSISAGVNGADSEPFPTIESRLNAALERTSRVEELAERMEERLSRIEQAHGIIPPQRSSFEDLVTDLPMNTNVSEDSIRTRILDAGPASREGNERSQLPRVTPLHGNVLRDIDLIEWMSLSDSGRADRWKETFFFLYGLDYDMAKDDIRAAPRQLIILCNIIAAIRLDPSWTEAWPIPTLFFYAAVCENLVDRWSDALLNNYSSEDFWADPDHLDTFRRVYEWHHERLATPTPPPRNNPSIFR